MTTQALGTGILDRIFAVLDRRAQIRRARSASPEIAATPRERHELVEEMLLNNPAAFASEFGLQWMYAGFPRD